MKRYWSVELTNADRQYKTVEVRDADLCLKDAVRKAVTDNPGWSYINVFLSKGV
jgi:hypothetical protein